MSSDLAVMPQAGGVLDGVRLHHVTCLDELDNFRRWISGRLEGPLSADTESASLRFYRDRHRMTQIGDCRDGWSFPQGWMGAAHEVLLKWPGRIGFFNAPYDWLVMACQDGVELPWDRIDDGQIACQLVDSAAVLKLKPRCARDIDPSAMTGERLLEEAKRANGWDWATVPDNLPEYWMYGALDPVQNSHLLARHMPLVRQRYSAAYDLEIAYARLCANMMRAGMMIDIPYITHWSDQIGAWNDHAMAWLAGQWGVTSVESNAIVGEALLDAGVRVERTPTGMVKIDKETMAAYQSEHPEAAELIAALRGARKAQSITGRYLSKFLEMADDGVIHYSIHSIGAQRTSRSSVTAPPMHTYDRDVPVMRGSFRPRPGHCFIAWDANQIELRLAAHFSGDQRLIADFAHCDATGASFFQLNAERIYAEAIAKTDPRYTLTKNTIYGTTYGAGPDTAARTAGIPLEQILPIYNGFKTSYSQLAKRSFDLIARAKRMKRPQVSTWYGRALMLDRGKEYAGVDYEIQGSAAEFMKTCALRMDAAGYGPNLRLTIHDEILGEFPVADAERILQHGVEIMTDRTSFRVPITWEGKIMTERWVK
jgi:DNA polymerase-1